MSHRLLPLGIALALLATHRTALADEGPPPASALEPGSLGAGYVGLKLGLMGTPDAPTGALSGEVTAGLGRVDVSVGGAYTPGSSECDGESCHKYGIIAGAVQTHLGSWNEGRSRLGLRMSLQKNLLTGRGVRPFTMGTALVRWSFDLGSRTRGFADALAFVQRTPAYDKTFIRGGGQLGLIRSFGTRGYFVSLGMLPYYEGAKLSGSLPMLTLGVLRHWPAAQRRTTHVARFAESVLAGAVYARVGHGVSTAYSSASEVRSGTTLGFGFRRTHGRLIWDASLFNVLIDEGDEGDETTHLAPLRLVLSYKFLDEGKHAVYAGGGASLGEARVRYETRDRIAPEDEPRTHSASQLGPQAELVIGWEFAPTPEMRLFAEATASLPLQQVRVAYPDESFRFDEEEDFWLPTAGLSLGIGI